MLGAEDYKISDDVKQEIDPKTGKTYLVIPIKPRKEEDNLCPYCRRKCEIHDYLPYARKWRTRDLGCMKAYLEYVPKRVICKHCLNEAGNPKVSVQYLSWAQRYDRATKSFNESVMLEACKSSVQFSAKSHRVCWRTVQNTCNRGLKRKDAEREKEGKGRFDNLETIVMDETSKGKHCKGTDDKDSDKPSKYMTIMSNPDTKEVLGVIDGYGTKKAQKLLSKIRANRLKKVKLIAGDGARWIDSSIQNTEPLNVKRCLDSFHAISWTSDQLKIEKNKTVKKVSNEIRQLEAKEALTEEEKEELNKKQGFHKILLNKNTQNALFKKQENLTDKQKSILEKIKEEAPDLYDLYIHKEEFRKALTDKSRDPIKRSSTLANVLQEFIMDLETSYDEDWNKFGEKLKRHFDNIMNTSMYRKTSAMAEAINSKAKNLIRRACGFRNIKNFTTRLMLTCSQLGVKLFDREDEVFYFSRS